jgi:uncharacterized protein (TIGR02246 family)
MADEETSTRVDEVGIDRLRDRHIAALNAGDADAWVDCFTDDGVQMPPHFATNAGKPAVRRWSQGVLNLFECRFGLSVDEVRVAADWAFERGRYTITLTPRAGGGPMDDNGKYVTVYQRQRDGSWKIARDIWNSDQPLPGTP